MIGVEIENPFGHDYNDLPLDSITDDTIAGNLMELLERHVAKRADASGAASGHTRMATPANSSGAASSVEQTESFSEVKVVTFGDDR